ncbi:NAD(P)/FAD-dependent oxidoreductase [Caulobacter sp. 17J80-11]|uniref:NAD(P)/FAD-dependent oxidoreductase n=1 Tax=Caulobacter sp. 17J80-11 TaxID=2763502 RepID=UPI001653B237|nr:NAD(P)/FAD-dependent oxidoreductase [Caulobacter sp. 17J80-11]MBC6982734.1 NAD(P)/FAD-dependent oxidoreductase [Caulobacter sp. 17J80-11]
MADPSRPVRTRPRVVVVGAGFGGLEAVRALGRTMASITVIDRRNHHTFQPLLYQVATAALSPAEVAWPIREVLHRLRHVRVVLSAARAVDLEARAVETADGPFPYDFLVIAAGATHSYFGRDDWAAWAPGLKSIDDALRLRRRILSAFERAELARDLDELSRQLTFVVVGGGPTGVEMAGAIAEIARDALPRDFRSIDPATARIVLVEAGPRILPAMPEHLAAYAQRRLEAMGVEVMTGQMVTGVDAEGAALDGGRIEAATMIWAAGVQAAALVRALPGEHDRAGRLLVGPDLSMPGHPEVFVIGDAAMVARADGKPVPGIAPAAKQMGHYVGKVIAARIAGTSADAPFRYRHQGDLATIGRDAAVVKLGRVEITGFVGWLFWSVAHVYFLIGLRQRLAVATDWLWAWVTRRRGARLITDA